MASNLKLARIRASGLSFEQGAAAGGSVRYEESQADFRVRKLAYPFLGAFLVLTGALPFALAFYPAFNPVLFVMGILLLPLMTILAVAWSKQGQLVTPFRIYQNGISFGDGARPYRAFSELSAFEESLPFRGFHPLLLLTFNDGNFMALTSTIEKGIIYRNLGNDYSAAKDIMSSVVPLGFKPTLSWSKEAEDFVNRLGYVKGPVRVQAEILARGLGAGHVDLAFLLGHADEIAKHYGPGFQSFLRAAKEATR